MDRGRSVAYKRSWRENFVGRAAQTLPSTTQPSFLSSGMRKRDNWERRFYDVDSIAYFRSKTVQSMGGSSLLVGQTWLDFTKPLEVTGALPVSPRVKNLRG